MSDPDPRLAAYADGQLDAATAHEVERILANDAQARRIVDIHRETTALLRAACAEENYVAGSLSAPPRRRSAWLARAVAVAACVALLAIGYGAGRTVVQSEPGDSFIDDVAEYHSVYMRETTHLAELPAAQSDEIARWLGERLQRPLSALDLRAEGLQFAGARMWVSDGKPVADLLYTRDGAPPVALCIVRVVDDDGPQPGGKIKLTTRDGLRVAYWVDGDYTFAVVGDLTEANARRIAARVRRLSAI